MNWDDGVVDSHQVSLVLGASVDLVVPGDYNVVVSRLLGEYEQRKTTLAGPDAEDSHLVDGFFARDFVWREHVCWILDAV